MSSLRSPSVSIMRPPKPPSWRDFVDQGQKGPLQTVPSECSDPAGRNFGARSPISDIGESSKGPSSIPGTRPTKLSRRPRAKIHRTRSEHVIQPEELPKTAGPSDKSSRKPTQQTHEYDGRRYVEDNNRRCQTWLASIEACEPLDEVSYNEESVPPDADPGYVQLAQLLGNDEQLTEGKQSLDLKTIPISHLDDDVDVEIPEERYAWENISNDRPGEEVCLWDPPGSCDEKNLKHSGKSCFVKSFSPDDRGLTVRLEPLGNSEDSVADCKVVRDKDDSESSERNNCNKLCCDFYKSFNSSRRKSVQNEGHDMK